jgi:hypothetical protein
MDELGNGHDRSWLRRSKVFRSAEMALTPFVLVRVDSWIEFFAQAFVRNKKLRIVSWRH